MIDSTRRPLIFSRLLATATPSAAAILFATIAPAAKAQFYIYDGGPTGTGQDINAAENWFKLPSSNDLLPIAANGGGNAFIGAIGGAGGTKRNVFLGDGVNPVSLTFVSELQVGTEANPYGQSGSVLGGAAALTIRNNATVSVSGNVVIGQGRDNVNDNSGEVIVEAGGTFNHNADRVLIGFYDNDGAGTTTGILTVNGGTVNSTKPGNRFIVGGWDSGFAENFGRGIVNINAGTVNTLDVIIGAGGGSGIVNHSDGIWNVNGFFTTAAVGTIRNTTQGTYNLSGDPLTSVLNVGFDFTVHEQGTVDTAQSTFNQSGGTVNLNATGINTIGRASTGQGKGVYNLSGGVVNVNNANLNVGGTNNGSIGELNISNTGQLNLNNAASLVLGQNSASVGTVTQTGGNVTISEFSGSGLSLASGLGSTGTYNLNAGTLTLGKITNGLGSGTLNFNGGTLKANAPFNASGFTSTINAGGAFIDTNGNDVIWSPGFDGSGGLTKQGEGTLSLFGFNFYSGSTLVNGGTVDVVIYVDGAATVSAGATLNVSSGGQLNGHANILAGGTASGTGSYLAGITSDGTIAPGPGIGTLSSGATVTLSASATLSLEIDTTSLMSDLLDIVGDLKLSDVDLTKLTISDVSPSPITTGTFTFLTYSGSWDGDLFTYGGQAIPDGGIITVGTNHFSLDYNRNGNSVALIAVPEPGSAIAMLCGLSFLGLSRRQRRKAQA